VLDGLAEEGETEALTALVVIDAEVDQAEGAGVWPGLGDETGDDEVFVLGDECEAFVGAGGDLAEEEAGVVVEGIGGDQPLAERAFFDMPGGCEVFAGTVEVEIAGGFDGAVDVGQEGGVSRGGGADLHGGHYNKG